MLYAHIFKASKRVPGEYKYEIIITMGPGLQSASIVDSKLTDTKAEAKAFALDHGATPHNY